MGMVPVEKRSRLFLHLKKWLEKAVMDYGMIADGDRVLVGVSGGMDSMSLLDLLNTPMITVPPFSIVAVNIDPGFDPSYSGYDALEGHLKAGAYDYVMEKTDIGTLSHSDYNRKNPCFLCSRLRRKRIFEIACGEGMQQDRLRPSSGRHHRDAADQSLLRPGDQHHGPEPDDLRGGDADHPPLGLHPGGAGEEVRRRRRGFPAIENGCPTSRTSRRSYVKKLLDELEKDNRRVRENIWTAMGHVKTDYLPAKIDGP